MSGARKKASSSITPIGEAEMQTELQKVCTKAIESAARRLGTDPTAFATRCTEGELAELVFELRTLRHLLPTSDRERVEELLRRIGVLP